MKLKKNDTTAIYTTTNKFVLGDNMKIFIKWR